MELSAESVGCWRNRVGFGMGQLDELLSLAELWVSPLKTGGQLCTSFRLVLQVRENSIGGTKDSAWKLWCARECSLYFLLPLFSEMFCGVSHLDRGPYNNASVTPSIFLHGPRVF